MASTSLPSLGSGLLQQRLQYRGCEVLEDVTVATLLLRYLQLEGVRYMFGIPGGGVAHVLTMLKDHPGELQYVICRHESGAAYAADGYYRATGQLGVVLTTTGPGATNALTGAMNAQAGGSAVLVLCGEVNEQYDGMGYLQEGIDAGLNVSAVFRAATGYSAVVTEQSNFQTLLTQALRNALSLPRQAVQLSLPNNICAEKVPQAVVPKSPANYRTVPCGVSAGQVEQTLQLLTQCRRPLIFLGNGCRGLTPQQLEQLAGLVTRHGIPVMTTADGKGIFPESHPLSLGVYGFANCLWPQYWLEPERLDPRAPAYDGLLVLGSSLHDLSTNKWDPMLLPDGPFIHVDLAQSIIGRSFHVTHGIVAEVGAFIEEASRQLPAYLPDPAAVRERTDFMARIKQSSPFFDQVQYQSDASPMQPAALMRVLQDKLPADAFILLDAGNCVGWAIHYLRIDPPRQIHAALSMGPMGFAVAAAVGAKLGAPKRCVTAIVGDGAFLMHGAEVSTAAKFGLGAIWIVLNDDDLRMVSQGQAHFFPGRDPAVWSQLYRLGNPNLVEFASGLGADAYLVDNPADFAKKWDLALAGAANRRPQVIVAKIDFNAQPPYYNPAYMTTVRPQAETVAAAPLRSRHLRSPQ
jgi:acetolactate synthase I/II/III large subunit